MLNSAIDLGRALESGLKLANFTIYVTGSEIMNMLGLEFPSMGHNDDKYEAVANKKRIAA